MPQQTVVDYMDVHCPCGVTSRVPGRLEGRRIRCPGCRQGVAVELDLADDLLPVQQEERRCGQCCAKLAGASQVCMRCGRDRRRRRGGRRALTRVQPRASLKDRILPLCLIAAGSVTFVAVGAAADGADGVVAVATQLFVGVSLWVAAAIVAAMVAGRFVFKSDLGRVDEAILKLAAAGVVPETVALIALISLPVIGVYVAWIALLIGTWFMLSWLFEMSLPEAFFYAFLIRLSTWFLVKPLLALILAQV